MATRTHRIRVFSDGSIKVRNFGLDPVRWAILHDNEIGSSRPSGRPAIVRTYTLDEYKGGPYTGTAQTWRQNFTSKMQHYWFELCSLQRFGVKTDLLSPADLTWLTKRFCGGPHAIAGTLTFLNNKAGLDICRNYITGEVDGRDPAKIELLLCEGNGNRVLNTLTGKIVQNAYNQKMLAFDCIDPTNLPEPDLNTPGILFATNMASDGSVFNFSQLQIDGDGCPTPYPLFKKNGVQPYYPVDFLRSV